MGSDNHFQKYWDRCLQYTSYSKTQFPHAPYSMLDHVQHLVFVCHGACIENTTLIGVGGGEG